MIVVVTFSFYAKIPSNSSTMNQTRSTKEYITSKVVGSADDIPRADWDRLFSGVCEGYGFFKSLEESGLKCFEFYYVLIYKAGLLVLIAG